MRAIVGFAAFAALAPLQCPSTPRPERAHEETPAEALWQLSERFVQQGDPAAQRATLTFLVERYPASRYAERARAALGPDASAPR